MPTLHNINNRELLRTMLFSFRPRLLLLSIRKHKSLGWLSAQFAAGLLDGTLMRTLAGVELNLFAWLRRGQKEKLERI
jgi:hypothetical protein